MEPLVIGAAAIAAGLVVGGLVGIVHRWTGLFAGVVVAGVGGAIWGISKLGVAGMGCSLAGAAAAVIASAEARHAYVAMTADVVPMPSLTAWDPASAVGAMEVAPLEPGTRFRWTEMRTSGSGKSRGTVTETATPWLENGVVVGFACGRPNDANEGGRYALAFERWEGDLSDMCTSAVSSSEKLARQAGAEVRPLAAKRIVRVFATEAALRRAHDLGLAVRAPAVLLGVFWLTFVALRLVKRAR